MTWIKPPWRDFKDDTDEDDTGCWPWCGDQFLAAVRTVSSMKTPRGDWEFFVAWWTEHGLEAIGGTLDWSESDIEWIARIPEPLSVEAKAVEGK